MDQSPRESNFRSAYTAAKQAIESRQRPLSIGWAIVCGVGLGAALILALEVNRWLAARFLLSGLERTLLDLLSGFLIFSIYLSWRWRIFTKRNKV